MYNVKFIHTYLYTHLYDNVKCSLSMLIRFYFQINKTREITREILVSIILCIYTYNYNVAIYYNNALLYI